LDGGHGDGGDSLLEGGFKAWVSFDLHGKESGLSLVFTSDDNVAREFGRSGSDGVPVDGSEGVNEGEDKGSVIRVVLGVGAGVGEACRLSQFFRNVEDGERVDRRDGQEVCRAGGERSNETDA
jgi:hypothetical protein